MGLVLDLDEVSDVVPGFGELVFVGIGGCRVRTASADPVLCVLLDGGHGGRVIRFLSNA